ncbi:MAG: phage major capsid protein [Pseudomonadota bacterium]
MTLKDLHEKIQTALKAARDICDAVDQGNREFTAEERQQVKGHLEEAAQLKGQIKESKADADLRQQIIDLGSGIDVSQRNQGDPNRHPVGVAAGQGKTIGERFVDAQAIKDWMAIVAPNGHIAEGRKGLQSPAVEFKDLLGLHRKTLLTGDSATSGGAFVQTDYTGIYEPLGRRLFTLRDLISIRATTSDTVEFARQTAKVTQSAPVAEANVTDYAGATGEVSGEKPEATMAFEKVTATVKTIACWIPATKRALSDAAQLRGIIDQDLRDDLQEDWEDELVAGDGTGEHFTGIENTSGHLTQAWDTDLLTTARKAVTAVRVTGRARPTAWLVHPNDAETIDLLKDGQNRFYGNGPFDTGFPRLWRYPIVECEAVTEGQGILGDFRKAVWWDREQATIQVSDSHSDFFIRNMVAILAEMRGAFGLIRPSAFILVDLTSGS